MILLLSQGARAYVVASLLRHLPYFFFVSSDALSTGTKIVKS
jgi:hypothetical protein